MTIVIYIDTPFLSISEYARRTGQAVKTIRNDIDTGLLPTYQRAKGAKHLINMVVLAQIAASKAPPLEPWNRPQKVAELTPKNA
jgi:hypothetical protein